MGVRDRLPEMGLERVVREADVRRREIKAEQAIGSDSVVLERVASDATFDLQVGVLPTFRSRVIEVTYTPKETHFGGGLVYKLAVQMMNTGGVVSVYSPRIERQRAVGNNQVWRVYANSDATMRLKFFFFAIGTGSFSATVLY